MSGHFDDKPGSLVVLDRLREKHPEIDREVGWEHLIVRDYDVPYIAGSSRDGRRVYIDRHLPRLVGGIEVAKYLRLHEATEFALVRVLGYEYEPAHHLATAAEKREVEGDGYVWKEYRDAFRRYYKPIGHERLVRPPKDLALYPYSGELRILLEQVSRGKLTKAAVDYRRGSAARNCGLCSMFRSPGECTLVAGKVSPEGLCNRWDPK